MPILWHVVRIYAAQGFRRFLLLTGYLGEMIEEFVATIAVAGDDRVECVDTGLDTPTGGRVFRAAERLDGGPFAVTYADGVADIDLGARSGRSIEATATSRRSPWCGRHAQFGVAELDDEDRVLAFEEKPRLDQWVNGGFFCLRAGLPRLPRGGQRARELGRFAGWRRTASSMRSVTPDSGTAWTPTRTPSCSMTCGGRRPRHGRYGSETGRWTPVPASCARHRRARVRRRLDLQGSCSSAATAWSRLDRASPRGAALGPRAAGDDGRGRRGGGRPARRASSCRATLAEHDVDVVFHLAAQTIVGAGGRRPRRRPSRRTSAEPGSCSRPAVSVGVGRVGRRLVGQGVRRPRRAALPRGLRASTDRAVRGEQGGRRPDRAQLLASYGLPVAVTRFANIYGGGDTNFSRLIPEAVSAALDGRAPVLRSDGSPQRDFLYVEDAARAPTWRSPMPSTATRCGARRSTRAGGAPMQSARWLS